MEDQRDEKLENKMDDVCIGMLADVGVRGSLYNFCYSYSAQE